MKTSVFVAALLLFFVGCASKEQSDQSASEKWIDPSPHCIQLVSVAQDTKVEVLDWGGKGESIVFIAGLGNTAHVFDDFAPQFTDAYHVFGMTRRGFGASTQPPATSLRMLAEDTRTVLDSLRIHKAILIGHSFAGDEISKFASTYPERVKKIVYLDAAYDRVGLQKVMGSWPQPPPPTRSDSASVENMQKYLHRILPQILFPLAELRAWFRLSREGHVIGDITPDSVAYEIIDRLEHPAYAKIESPSLSFYAMPVTIDQLFPYINILDSAGKANAAKAFPLEVKLIEFSRQQFESKMKAGKVITIEGGHHYIFMSHRDQVTKSIRDFLRSD